MNIETLLTFSHALFADLMPQDLRHQFSGMTPSAHAAMIDRQAAKIDAALVTFALAAGETEVRQVFNALERETVIALCSRWCHCHEGWKKLPSDPKSHLWYPPDQKDLWRAIFLGMIGNADVAATLRERLMAEGYEVSRG